MKTVQQQKTKSTKTRVTSKLVNGALTTQQIEANAAKSVLADAGERIRELYSEVGNLATCAEDDEVVRLLALVRSLECDVDELAGYMTGEVTS